MKSSFLTALLTILPLFAKADSFFRLETNESGDWRLLDPEGEPFYLRGLNHYGDGSHMPWNLNETHGDAAGWRKSLPPRLTKWGFNYLPPSVGPSAIDPKSLTEEDRKTAHLKMHRGLVTRTPEWPAQNFAELNYPFTIFLEYPKQYMSGGGLPDVFSEEFRKAVDERCREVCEPLKNNTQLIGYHYCHNPPWHPQAKSFKRWIDDIVKPDTAAMKQWILLMRRVYGSVERWRETYGYPIESWDDINTLEKPLRGYVSHARMLKDCETFMRLMCREWYRIYHQSVRKYDKNHLIFGDRNTLHLQPLPDYAVQEMKPYIDVLSVNVMGPPNTIYGVLEQATRHWDGPIHLSDTGAGIYHGEPATAAFTSRDIDEFERVYSGMMKMGVNHPQIIGFGWCGFYETPHPGGRSGLVDCRNGKPLADRLAIIKKWNAWIERQPKFQR